MYIYRGLLRCLRGEIGDFYLHYISRGRDGGAEWGDAGGEREGGDGTVSNI